MHVRGQPGSGHCDAMKDECKERSKKRNSKESDVSDDRLMMSSRSESDVHFILVVGSDFFWQGRSVSERDGPMQPRGRW